MNFDKDRLDAAFGDMPETIDDRIASLEREFDYLNGRLDKIDQSMTAIGIMGLIILAKLFGFIDAAAKLFGY